MSRPEFEELESIYVAIKDLDKVINSNSTDKIDEAVNCIKNLDKNQFDSDTQTKILLDLRNGLMKMYSERINHLDESIGANNQRGNLSPLPTNPNRAAIQQYRGTIPNATEKVISDGRNDDNIKEA